MARIEDYENDPNWYRSLGEQLGKTHFRNGHLHAVCDSRTGICSVHYDRYDPHKSLPDLIRHTWGSDLGKVAIIFGVVASAGLAARHFRKKHKNRIL